MSIQAVKPQPVAVSRMTLKSITKGKQDSPIRALIYAPEGIGKSTFAASAPKPIFLTPEEGTMHLDVERFPTPQSWPEIIEAIKTLREQPHDYQTLVLDTLDHAEPMLWAYICKRDAKKDIEDYGYGKGYVAALDEWRILIALLEKLEKEKGMNILLLAHSWIRPFKSPELEAFDRYELKLNAKAAGLIKEWVHAALFANYETAIKKDGQKRARGIDTGSRLLHTQWTAAYDAKNRYSLRETLPLDWTEFDNAVHAGQVADPDALAAEIERKAKQLGGQMEVKTLASLLKVRSDTQKMAILNNWVNVKLTEKESKND